MPFLIFRSAPNVSSVDEDGQGMRTEGFAYRRFCVGDVFRNSAETVPHGGVVLLGTRQKRLQDPGRFPKRMARTQLGLKYLQLRCRAITEDLRERRERAAFTSATRTLATPRDLQWKPSKERIENPGP